MKKKTEDNLDEEILVTLSRKFRMKRRDFENFRINKIEKSKLVKDGDFCYTIEKVMPGRTMTNIYEED